MTIFRRPINWLKDRYLDLLLSWHAARADQLREDQEPYYIVRREPLFPSDKVPPLAASQDRTPPGRCSDRRCCRTGRCQNCPERSPIRTAAALCVNCGHRGSVLVPAGAEPAEVENEIVDMLECPVCGAYTMCSD